MVDITKETTRKKIGDVIGMAIPEGGILTKLEDADRRGAITNSKMIRIVALLAEKIDEYEALE